MVSRRSSHDTKHAFFQAYLWMAVKLEAIAQACNHQHKASNLIPASNNSTTPHPTHTPDTTPEYTSQGPRSEAPVSKQHVVQAFPIKCSTHNTTA